MTLIVVLLVTNSKSRETLASSCIIHVLRWFSLFLSYCWPSEDLKCMFPFCWECCLWTEKLKFSSKNHDLTIYPISFLKRYRTKFLFLLCLTPQFFVLFIAQQFFMLSFFPLSSKGGSTEFLAHRMFPNRQKGVDSPLALLLLYWLHE